ncbi:MAG TPA: methyltransferase domain-containing protein [Casimicrobiaceae bacterium]|nr:methyltransferase domain-containing protein [Casimicrobiaceae bacterium]
MATVIESNDAFTAFWNDVMVPKFERFRDIMMDGLSYHSRVPLGRLSLPPGARALDVGCGWGDTAIELARKVGPTGKVVGLDCCDAFLEKGRRDAAAEGLGHVHFVAADVQTHHFEPEFDFAFSRFGMMFFANPVAAMRNVRSAMRPGATLMFITWRVLEDNPWLAVPKAVVLRYLPPPGENAQTCGPGPFSMANPDVVRAQLAAAGFTDVAFERLDGPVMIGRDVEQALDVQLTLGPAGEIVREAGARADECRDVVTAALRDELARHAKSDGVWMQSSSWTITARNPG